MAPEDAGSPVDADPGDADPVDVGVLADSGPRPRDAGVRPDAAWRPDAAPADSGRPEGLRLELGETIELPVPPPPLSGGTLLLSRDGARLFASDPDRDLVYGVELATRRVAFTSVLSPGDEPGRLVEDGAGRVHVVLRGAAAVLALDAATGTTIARRAVCVAPRGLAWDAAEDRVFVACARGELASFAAAGGPVETRFVDFDLRDLVSAEGKLFVTRFRAAELLELDRDRAIVRRVRPANVTDRGDAFAPAVAWRAVSRPSGGVAWVHQEAMIDAVNLAGAGYYSGPTSTLDAGFVDDAGRPESCPPNGVGRVVVTIEAEGEAPRRVPVPSAVLPLDVSFSPDGARVAVVSGANGPAPEVPQLVVVETDPPMPEGGCRFELPVGPRAPGFHTIAVAFTGPRTLVAQSREPAALAFVSLDAPSESELVLLSSSSAADTGHTLFHANTRAGVACASCHPEGHEDARTWRFVGADGRRTQSLRGTIAGTAPYHWSGDFSALHELVDVDFGLNMGGAALSAEQNRALERYAGSLSPLPSPTPTDPEAVERGRIVFEGAALCSTCHAGPSRTNNETVDVGSGGSFQVPSLVGVSWRAPYFHDGCATTIFERPSETCGGGAHAMTAGLLAADLEDLAAFLDTL